MNESFFPFSTLSNSHHQHLLSNKDYYLYFALQTNIDHFMMDDPQIPNAYICPMTLQLMNDPVSVDSGHTFERKEIQEWLRKKDTNPVTNLPLPSKKLVPNIPLKQLIEDYKQKQKQKLRIVKISNLMNSYAEKEKTMRQRYRMWEKRFQQKIHQLPSEEFSYGAYKGEVQNNQPDGEGVMNYSDGSTYGGQWEEGERSGFGRLICNEMKLFGEWKNGKLNGIGWVLRENTDRIIYRCEWKNGKRDGFGMHYDYEHSRVYTGYWKQNKRHGEGKEQNTSTGQTFIGTWRDGVRHGQGQTRFRNGMKAKERWDQGEKLDDKEFIHDKPSKDSCCKLI